MDPANEQQLSDIMTYFTNIDYEFMICETEKENYVQIFFPNAVSVHLYFL